MNRLNTEWIIETSDRALKSFGQAIVLYLGGGSVLIDGFDVDWVDALGFGVGAAVLSAATSLASGSLFKSRATPASMLRASKRAAILDGDES